MIRVLHVDDDPLFAETTAERLEDHDDRFDVETVGGADEAEARLGESATEIDCVVSDYEMSGRNGLELLDAVRAAYPDLPFILFSRTGSEEVASEAIPRGVTDYLQKRPGVETFGLLAKRIENAVERARTEQRLEEQRRQLREQTELFRWAQEAADIGSWTYDTRTGAVVMSDTAYEIHGLSPDAEMSPERSLELYHEADRPRIREAFRRAVAEGESYDVELRLIDADGTRRWVRTFGEPEVVDGTVARVNGVIQDVTERRAREAKLELIETLFDHAQECQFIVEATDDEFNLRHANSYYKGIVGLSPGESVTGQTPVELFGRRGGEEIIARYEECLERGEPITYTVELSVPEDGTVYRTILTPVDPDGDASYVVGTARDVTDLKRREDELERQNQRLEEFADVMGHDLRGPLTLARSRLELVDEESDGEDLEQVVLALDRMAALIEDLLALAREGNTVPDTEPVELAALFERCWRTVETGSASFEIAADCTFRADRSRLEQACANLIRNSIEHGGNDVTVAVGPLEDGFYVEDDGPGIPDDARENVFDTGYSTKDAGTGFGLSIVAEIVEAHGWEIRVTTGSDGGARFEITGVEFDDG